MDADGLDFEFEFLGEVGVEGGFGVDGFDHDSSPLGIGLGERAAGFIFPIGEFLTEGLGVIVLPFADAHEVGSALGGAEVGVWSTCLGDFLEFAVGLEVDACAAGESGEDNSSIIGLDFDLVLSGLGDGVFDEVPHVVDDLVDMVEEENTREVAVFDGGVFGADIDASVTVDAAFSVFDAEDDIVEFFGGNEAGVGGGSIEGIDDFGVLTFMYSVGVVLHAVHVGKPLEVTVMDSEVIPDLFLIYAEESGEAGEGVVGVRTGVDIGVRDMEVDTGAAVDLDMFVVDDISEDLEGELDLFFVLIGVKDRGADLYHNAFFGMTIETHGPFFGIGLEVVGGIDATSVFQLEGGLIAPVATGSVEVFGHGVEGDEVLGRGVVVGGEFGFFFIGVGDGIEFDFDTDAGGGGEGMITQIGSGLSLEVESFHEGLECAHEVDRD